MNNQSKTDVVKSGEIQLAEKFIMWDYFGDKTDIDEIEIVEAVEYFDPVYQFTNDEKEILIGRLLKHYNVDSPKNPRDILTINQARFLLGELVEREESILKAHVFNDWYDDIVELYLDALMEKKRQEFYDRRDAIIENHDDIYDIKLTALYNELAQFEAFIKLSKNTLTPRHG